MSDLELVVYSKGLDDLPIEDLEEVIKTLSLTPREEFEPKIPELAQLRRMVQKIGWARRREDRESEEKRLDEERRKHFADHPEERCSIAGLLKDVMDKNGMSMDTTNTPAAKPAPVQVPAECPHCHLAASLEGDPAALGRIAKYYNDKALRALSKMAQEQQKM